MPTALRPENWLDWVIAIYVLLGLWQGLRRGLVLSVVGIAATVLAVILATHYSPQAVQFANTRWQTERHLEQYLSRQMQLPDGAGQVPYSTAAVGVLRQDMQHTAPGSAGVALAGVFSQPAPTPPPATLQAYFDEVVAARIMGLVAFVALVVAAEFLFHGIGGVLFSRLARRGVLGLVNRGLGALLGAGERIVEAAIVLALATGLAAVPAAAALAPVLHGSRWAPALVGVFHQLLPRTGKWMSWLT